MRTPSEPDATTAIEAPRVHAVGEAAFTVEFGQAVSKTLNRRVHALDAALQADPPPGLRETVPTYRSLLVLYDPLAIDGEAMRERLHALAQAVPASPAADRGRLIEIPVRYGGADGPDLEAVADHCGLSPEEIIRRHTGATYTVAMLGFAPGFTYLLGLPSALTTPRLATPRTRVPPGSVGIAGAQTGLYALGTPGGWRIIGRTSMTLFDPQRQPPFALRTGDRIRFAAIRSPNGWTDA
jgi:KipI family sensor histidine kinase inhibitor